MDRLSKDTQLAATAARTIFDNRNLDKDSSAILITMEHTIATILLALFHGDSAKAARMLNEGLVPGIEMRLALYAATRKD